MRTFFITDTHGLNTRFKELLKMANFDYEKDRLIHCGDVVDKGSESFWHVEELMKIINLIPVRGNHDWCFWEWLKTGNHPLHAYFPKTEQSYIDGLVYVVGRLRPEQVPKRHIDFFANQVDYFIDEQNRMFCHAGYDRDYKIEEQDPQDFHWNHSLLAGTMERTEDQEPLPDINSFKRIFVGHRVTMNWKDENGNYIVKPIYKDNVVAGDTGGFLGGKLSLIDITDDENHILYQN